MSAILLSLVARVAAITRSILGRKTISNVHMVSRLMAGVAYAELTCSGAAINTTAQYPVHPVCCPSLAPHFATKLLASFSRLHLY